METLQVWCIVSAIYRTAWINITQQLWLCIHVSVCQPLSVVRWSFGFVLPCCILLRSVLFHLICYVLLWSMSLCFWSLKQHHLLGKLRHGVRKSCQSKERVRIKLRCRNARQFWRTCALTNPHHMVVIFLAVGSTHRPSHVVNRSVPPAIAELIIIIVFIIMFYC